MKYLIYILIFLSFSSKAQKKLLDIEVTDEKYKSKSILGKTLIGQSCQSSNFVFSHFVKDYKKGIFESGNLLFSDATTKLDCSNIYNKEYKVVKLFPYKNEKVIELSRPDGPNFYWLFEGYSHFTIKEDKQNLIDYHKNSLFTDGVVDSLVLIDFYKWGNSLKGLLKDKKGEFIEVSEYDFLKLKVQNEDPNKINCDLVNEYIDEFTKEKKVESEIVMADKVAISIYKTIGNKTYMFMSFDFDQPHHIKSGSEIYIKFENDKIYKFTTEKSSSPKLDPNGAFSNSFSFLISKELKTLLTTNLITKIRCYISDYDLDPKSSKEIFDISKCIFKSN